MAITNREILETETALRGIKEPVDTFAGWKRKGFYVTKGSKALFETSIWKPCKTEIKKEDGTIEQAKRLYMVKACFFGMSQVKPLRGKNV